MRLFTAGFLLLVPLALASPLGRLVQPDGSSQALAETSEDGSRTLLFAKDSIPSRSWLLFPAGVVIVDAEVRSAGQRRVVTFPAVRAPGLRFGIEVPSGLLSVRLRGRVPAALRVERSPSPPASGGWVLRSRTELRVDLPPWTASNGWTPYVELTRSRVAPWRVRVADGAHSQEFAFLSSVRRWVYAPDAWGVAPHQFVVTGPDPGLAEVKVLAIRPEAPRPADPPTLLQWPTSRWRSPTREWFHWSGTAVLVLVTADYRTQDQYLKRLAFYVEKQGFRGKLWTDSSIANLHAWNAHDYAAPDLARFYNQAEREGFRLNAAENELRDRLVDEGILVKGQGEPWAAGTGALIGVSAESAPALRSVLFVHEAFHGLYFTTPEFRAAAQAAWEALSPAARSAFRDYLSKSRYDPSDEGLMINEFQAYVLQRPAQEWESFFRDRVLAAWSADRPKLNVLVEFLAASQRLDAFVQGRFGFPSGNVSAVSPVSGT